MSWCTNMHVCNISKMKKKIRIFIQLSKKKKHNRILEIFSTTNSMYNLSQNIVIIRSNILEKKISHTYITNYS